MQNYAEMMFTKPVQDLQEAEGTRALYAEKYPERTQAKIGADEAAFLSARDSIYIATVSETGWPYIQHRGGPVGFIKLLDETTIGFADYRGNRQFISQGNLLGEARMSIFAMDYARKARLKLQGLAHMQPASDAPDLAERLSSEGQGRVERVVTIRIEAMYWNCPQFITPRFDQAQITQMVGPEMSRLEARVQELEAETARLRQGT